MKYFVILLVLIGFTGISFAEESPGSPIPEPEQDNPVYENCGPGTTYQDGICVVDEIENSTTSSSDKWDTAQSIDRKSNSDIIPPPLKQMKLGIKLGHIICDKDKFPVWNTHYKPACVYPDTESELIKRGWAKLRLMLPAGPDPIKELDWMGRNVMSMMLEGTFSYSSTPVETLDEKRAAIWEYSQQYHPGEQYLEYAIIPHQNHYNVGDKIQFDLLEWGNYSGCWDLKLRIIDRYDQSVFENNSEIVCLEPDGTSGTFNSYSMKEDLYPMGGDFDEFVCDTPGYYRIEVSNGDIFPTSILQNFACLDSELTSIEKLLISNQIDYLPDKLVVTSGHTIRGDPGCGAVVDTNSITHWFGIDSISEPKKITLFSENPNHCEVNTSSCFCNAQMELSALTLDELNYFTLEEQEKFANILIDYLAEENINRTPKFQIGKLNINYTDSSAIGYCGEIWGKNTYGFFDGAIVNDVVKDYGIDKELPLLCAISDDAKWWE